MGEIDRLILKALFEKGNLYHNRLFEEVSDFCKKKVAKAVFGDSLKRLLAEKKIERIVETEGRPRVMYRLYDERTREEFRFKILKLRSPKKRKGMHQKEISISDSAEEVNHERMYQLLFFLGTVNPPIYELRTEKALEKFLASIGLSNDDLHIVEYDSLRATIAAETWLYAPRIRIDEKISIIPMTSITPPYALSITHYETPIPGLTIWKERFTYSEYPNKEIFRPELEGLRTKVKELKVRGLAIKLYRYTVPGVAISDLLNDDRRIFQHINLRKEEVKRTIDLLKENGMIKLALVFQKEERYDITDEKLAKVIASCWEVFYTLLEALILTCVYIRRSTDKEREWLSMFYGSKIAEDIIRNCHYYRSNLPQEDKEKDFRLKVEEEVRGLKGKAMSDIKQIKVKHASTIEKYHFPLDSLISLILPPWFQE